MEKQEYIHIRNLSWDLLLDAGISKLPTDILAIAKLYDLQEEICSHTDLYQNALRISDRILQLFGYNNSKECVKALAVRLLAPSIVLKAIDIQSPYALGSVSGLPIHVATQRYQRYLTLVKRDRFGSHDLETRVLSRFEPWIQQITKFQK